MVLVDVSEIMPSYHIFITGTGCLKAVVMLLFIVAVSGSLTADLLQIPLFEAGHVWLNSTRTHVLQVANSITTLPHLISLWTCVIMAAIVICLYVLYALLFRPLNRVRKLDDIGYIPENGLSVKETANLVRKKRLVGNIPPAYPNGWFELIESASLGNKVVKSVSGLGKNFVVFRDENGSAHVMDAYCPHMGANLGAGGRIIDNCIECPFHAWRFRVDDGKCVYIPYADKIPDIARIKTWPVREVSGSIFVWYHADGIDPTWTIPEIEELEKGTWIYRGRTEHYISAHIEEISENGADLVHLDQVHGRVITAGRDLRKIWNKLWSFASHHWTAAWEPCSGPDVHISMLKLVHTFSVFGYLVPVFKLTVCVRQVGPGLVYMEFNSVLGKGMFLQTATPQGPLLQKVIHRVYTNSWMPAVVGKLCLLAEAIQVERDIMIWNNKTYAARPMFVKSREDTLISKHRRWFSQFYSDKSPRMFQKEDLTF